MGATEVLIPTESHADGPMAYYSLTASFEEGTRAFALYAEACVVDVCTDSDHITIFVDRDNSDVPQPTAIPTIYPTPQSAEDAAAAPMNCGVYLVEDFHYDPEMYGYPSLDSGIGASTPEEAYEVFGPYGYGTPDLIHRTEDEVIWVYLDENGQKIGALTALGTESGWFIVREQYCARVRK